MNLCQHLDDVMCAAGLPSLHFDQQGCARMLFEGEVIVNLERDEAQGILHLYGDLGVLPELGREALYRELLEANLVGAHTRGGILAVDRELEQVVLSRAVSIAELTPSLLSELLTGFVACIEHWQRYLADAADRGEPAMPWSLMRGVPVAGEP
jgi:hypothetical protein